MRAEFADKMQWEEVDLTRTYTFAFIVNDAKVFGIQTAKETGLL